MKLRLKYQLVILFLLISNLVFSQQFKNEKITRNTLFAEFEYNKNVDFYSILYDRMFNAKGIVKIGVQTGISFSTDIETGEKGYSTFFPIKGYLLVGRNNHYLESGFGFKILGFVFPDFNFGYRYKQTTNGLSLRAGYSGIILPGGLQNMISISVGYTF